MAKSDLAKTDDTDAEKTGVPAVRSDPNFDPDVKLVSQEQLDRSHEIATKGVDQWKVDRDERFFTDKAAPKSSR